MPQTLRQTPTARQNNSYIYSSYLRNTYKGYSLIYYKFLANETV
jgi:hypothetical protein